jgi:hypothetical protein
MGKIPFADWMEWATKRPEWAWGDLGAAFETYVERKWRDALKVAVEPQGWEASGGKVDKGHAEKPAWGKPPGEKPTGVIRRAGKVTGAANIVTSLLAPVGRRCNYGDFTGCMEAHTAASCNKLRDLDPDTKQKALDACGLYMFCLRHALGAECYGRRTRSKLPCQIPECEGKHTESLHRMLVVSDASVSLVIEEEDEEEDNAYVNLSRAEGREEEDDNCREPDDSWLELEAGEEDEDGVFYMNALTGREDQVEDGDGIFYVDVPHGGEGERGGRRNEWLVDPGSVLAGHRGGR